MSFRRVAFSVLSFAAPTWYMPIADAQTSGGYNAEAYCIITHARGVAYGYRSSGAAISAAIANCKAKGGDPE